jgi:hypothetical protein
MTVAMIEADCNSPVTDTTQRKVKDIIKSAGIYSEYVIGLMQRRYKVRNHAELTEAEAICLLKHLEGYGV